AMSGAETQGLVEVTFDVREAGPVLVDELLGVGATESGVTGETVGLHTVEETKVDGFCDAALVRSDILGIDAVNEGGGGAVDVLSGTECIEKERLLADVGHEAEFDLRVVRGEERRVVEEAVLGTVVGNEGAADAATELRADWDVLEVGVDRGKATGSGDGLVEGGVDPAGLRVDLQGE